LEVDKHNKCGAFSVGWPENSAGVGGLVGLIALNFLDFWLLCIKTK